MVPAFACIHNHHITIDCHATYVARNDTQRYANESDLPSFYSFFFLIPPLLPFLTILLFLPSSLLNKSRKRSAPPNASSLQTYKNMQSLGARGGWRHPAVRLHSWRQRDASSTCFTKGASSTHRHSEPPPGDVELQHLLDIRWRSPPYSSGGPWPDTTTYPILPPSTTAKPAQNIGATRRNRAVKSAEASRPSDVLRRRA